jgi:hypothetical protein
VSASFDSPDSSLTGHRVIVGRRPARHLDPAGSNSREPAGNTVLVMRLVPDTSIVHTGGFYLTSGNWPMLLAAARMGRVRLWVPEVVIQETVAHYRSELVDAQRMIIRGNRKLRRLSQDRLPLHVLDDDQINEQVAIYDTWLRDTVREVGTVLPLPPVEHAILLRDVLTGRKPFSAGEKGYRDALIWHSVVVAAAAEPLVFVTNNIKDFLDASGTTLADDLADDLRAASTAPDAVRPLTGIDPVLDELLPEDTHALEFFVSFAASPAGRRRLKLLVDQYFEAERRVPLVTTSGTLPERVFEADVEGVQTAIEVRTATARPVGGDCYLVSGRIEGRAFIGGIVWGQDPFPSGWEVWDTLGDQEYVAFPHAQPVSLEFSARFTRPDQIDDLRLERATLLVEKLEYAAPRQRATPPSPGSPVLDRARWVWSELVRLLDLDARTFYWAMRDEAFVLDLSRVLVDLEPSVQELVSPADSAALTTDNLASMLEDPAGVRRMLESLGRFIEGLGADR